MQEEKDVYHVESAEQAKERLVVWSTRWWEVAPKSVATFERDFDATIAYYQLEGIAREWDTKHLLARTRQSSTATQVSSGTFLWQFPRG